MAVLTLEAVEKATTDSPGPAPRDVNDAFLGAAYGRAYRCMRSIREFASRGEADDALILTRALLALVARSLYVAQPEDARSGNGVWPPGGAGGRGTPSRP